MPFHKKFSTDFQSSGDVSIGLDVFQRLGHFLREGMKPSPAPSTLFAKAAQGIQILATLAAWREKTSREEGSRKGAKGAKECVR